jgi:flagellar motility protein MotE (MotC chaperone)
VVADSQKKMQETVNGFLRETMERKRLEKEYQNTISRLREEVSASQKSYVTSEKEVASLSVRLANLETERARLSHTVNALLLSLTY